MNNTLLNEIKKYKPVLTISRFLPRQAMKRLRFLFAILFALSLFCILLIQHNLIPTYILSSAQAIGLSFIFGALWIEQICLYTYHNWYYFNGLDSTIGQKGKHSGGITYNVAEIFSYNLNDSTHSFLQSSLGQNILKRLELQLSEIDTFIRSERTKLPADSITLAEGKTTSLPEIAEHIYELDSQWQLLLSQHGINKELFLETVHFVTDISLAHMRTERWWSRDALSHAIGIGSELAYGDAPYVHRFSEPLLFNTIFSEQTGITPYTTHHANKVLEVLASHSASNVLILGAVGVGKMDIIYNVAHLLTYGKGLHALNGHHLIVVDIEHLFSLSNTDQTLEDQVVQFFEEALAAGNITLVLPSLASFITLGQEQGLMIIDILDRYLAHPQLHIIAIDTPESNHQVLQEYKSITRRFTTLLIEPTNYSDTLELLKAAARSHEAITGKMISYPALLQVVESAERYLTDGVMPDRAISLLEKIFDATSDHFITQNTVAVYISTITGIEIGPLTSKEREHLLNLEETLATMVTGQNQAVESVANALRRIRIDTTRHDKPKGCFLFLGPTGVGKTALAKALALVYSKSEDSMVRFDMSEFSHADALGYLIGDNNGTGKLTDQLHDHPFSVILFDEFEKAHPMIHDLFLQILDEGYFTSTHRGKVDVRNTIIIATSNAGSTLISKLADSPILSEELQRHLIDNDIYRPELLNRFDEMIIFKPLTPEASRYILQKNLTSLAKRLRDDGYTLEIEDRVIDLLLEKGFSSEFGARPLQRAIQDLVESEIARTIILQDIKPGGTVKITSSMIEGRTSKPQ